MSLWESMKLKTTIKKIQNTKFVLNFILLTAKHCIQKHPIRDLFWQALKLDESRLPSSGIDTSCLKNVQ